MYMQPSLCHNASQKGLQVFSENLPELVISLSICFKLFTSILEDYEEVQRKLGLLAQKLLKYFDSRWLTLAPTLFWIDEQFDGPKHYFLVNVPDKQLPILHYKTYKKIFDQMKRKDSVTKIHFVGAFADMSNWFIVLFLEGEPLIHILHSQCASLSFYNNGKIPKVRVISRVDCKIVML